MKTPERLALARELRAQGMTCREIGERWGVSGKTIDTWLHDPDGSRHRARVQSYAGECESCGGTTDGSRGRGKAAKVCEFCLRWTPEALLGVLADFFAEHQRSPTKADLHRPGDPSDKAFVRVFGSWNAALRAAGLPINMDRDDATSRAMVAEVASGATYGGVAARYGCTASNVWQRVGRLGLRPSQRSRVSA